MDWRTKLLDPKPQARKDYTSLVTPVYRGSTVVFDDQAAVTDDWRQAENGYSYVLMARQPPWSWRRALL